MQENIANIEVSDKKNIITSRIFCVNTRQTYIYELLNGEIISETKVAA